MKENINYIIQSCPSSRHFTLDMSRISLSKHHVKALIEEDITEPRKRIKSKQTASGGNISFASWILI